MIKTFLFPKAISDRTISISLLILRVVFGALFMVHGWTKLSNFDATVEAFGQMGMGGSIAVYFAIFGEFFCGLGILTGFLFRLALIPAIITMLVAFFGVTGMDITGGGEMSALYLAVFVALYITGAGKYSVDGFVAKRI